MITDLGVVNFEKRLFYTLASFPRKKKTSA